MIRAIFGIEREFDRYYTRIKNKMLKKKMSYINNENMGEFSYKATEKKLPRNTKIEEALK